MRAVINEIPQDYREFVEAYNDPVERLKRCDEWFYKTFGRVYPKRAPRALYEQEWRNHRASKIERGAINQIEYYD